MRSASGRSGSPPSTIATSSSRRGPIRDSRPVRLYFDESGRLVRLVHWRPTAVGAVPTKIDYSDYRAVGGIQMPFQWTRTWTNNQVVIQMKEIRPNVAIDAARFGRP